MIGVLLISAGSGHAASLDISVNYAHDWGFSGKKWGWGLRLKQKKRAVVYLTPTNGHFWAGFALGQKAVDAAFDSGNDRRESEQHDERHRGPVDRPDLTFHDFFL